MPKRVNIGDTQIWLVQVLKDDVLPHIDEGFLSVKAGDKVVMVEEIGYEYPSLKENPRWTTKGYREILPEDSWDYKEPPKRKPWYKRWFGKANFVPTAKVVNND